MIFHITSNEAWLSAKELGEYRGDTLATEGFIHASLPNQVVKVANARFQGRGDLVLLRIDPGKLQAPLKFEDGGEGEKFPHIYGPLNIDAVVEVFPFEAGIEGTFILPEELR